MTQVADEVLEVSASGTGTGADGAAPTAVINRRGEVVPFEASRISVALQKAFLATEGQAAGSSARVRELVEEMTATVVETLVRRSLAGTGSSGRPVAVEEVQDQDDLVLMRSGEHAVPRSYIL